MNDKIRVERFNPYLQKCKRCYQEYDARFVHVCLNQTTKQPTIRDKQPTIRTLAEIELLREILAELKQINAKMEPK